MSKWITDTKPLVQWDVMPVTQQLDRDKIIHIVVQKWLPAFEGLDGNGSESAFEAYMAVEEELAAAARAVAPFVALEGIDDVEPLP